MVDRLVAVDDADYRLPEPVLQALATDVGARFATVADMSAATVPTGTTTSTLGYYAVGDGGAATYTAIATATKNYDIAGATSFRPVLSGSVHPKQFGTVNDGSALDNLALQACYDYAEDFGVLTIDGQGLTYTIGSVNAYDPVKYGWAHTGAIVTAGHIVENAVFRVAAGSTSGTVAASVLLSDARKPTTFRNCTFDGNRSNLGTVAAGREDGGAHLVHLYHPSIETVVPADFFPSGDVYFEQCTFKDAYSYGVRIDHIDALVKYVDCDWSVYGIAALMHATNNVIIGGTVTVGAQRAGMVPNPFEAEIEYGGAYTGTRRPNISVSGVAYSHVASEALVKLHNAPMQGLNWGTVRISDITFTGASGRVFDAVNISSASYPQASTLVIDELLVERSPSKVQPSIALLGTTASSKKVRVTRLSMPNKPSGDAIRLYGAEAAAIILDRPVFSSAGLIDVATATIDRLDIVGATNVSGSATYGILRDVSSPGNTTVKVLNLRDSELTQYGLELFDACLLDVRVGGVTLHTADSSGYHTRMFHLRGVAGRVRLKGVLLTGLADPVGGNGRQLIYAESSVTDGYIYLEDVRHLITSSSPGVSAAGLAAGKKVLVNVSPLTT